MENGERHLAGGRANAGAVVRVGDEVARPMHPQAPFVEAFMHHFLEQGITTCPQPRGIDEQGRQRLSWIEGIAPVSPYPDWAWDDGLLVDVAQRQRELHEAAANFVSPPEAVWAVSGGDYFPTEAAGELFCHNDLCMSNVIVDVAQRRVAGFVDFDYVAPTSRHFDIAVLARHWAPFGDPDGTELPPLDRVTRFRAMCDVHELDRGERSNVVVLATRFLEQARSNVRVLADGGNPGFRSMIATGYEATNRATVRWLADHRAQLIG